MCSPRSSPGSHSISSTWSRSCVSALSNTTLSPVALPHKISLFIFQDGVFPDYWCPLPHCRPQRPSSMLHHPQHALRTPGHRSSCPKISRTAGNLSSARHRSSVIRAFSSPIPSRLCAAVKRAAVNLDALHSFVWGGQDYPVEDDIWLVLRQSYVPFPRFHRAC